MPKTTDSLIQEAWADPVIFKKFARHMKKTWKVEVDHQDWKGKQEGKPHPDFRKWLTGNL